MKKVVFILGLFLILSACYATKEVNPIQPEENNDVPVQKDETQEQKFVNPIFYQPLEPMSIHSGYVYITPTFIKFMTPLDKKILNGTGKCKLLENKQDSISFLCDITWLLPNTDVLEAKISYSAKGLFYSSCLEIEESFQYLNEKYPSISNYCVTPPNYTPSESD